MKDAAVEKALKEFPIYMETKPEELVPGLYLSLFHGRKDKNEEMNEWGFQGPMIGPLKYVHTTYGSNLKIEFINETYEAMYGIEQPWFLTDDMLEFRGLFFGDWTVHLVGMNQDVPSGSDLERPK